MEFRQEKRNLPGEVKKECRGIVTVDFGLKRLRRHFLGKEGEKRMSRTPMPKEQIQR